MIDQADINLYDTLRDRFYDHSPATHIDIDQGWYDIVLQCHAELAKEDPDYMITQIKQKFGRLRYYIQTSVGYWFVAKGTQNHVKNIITKYETLSASTCEVTGKSGVLMRSPNGWFKTLNPEWASQNDTFKHYVVFDR